MTCFQVELDRVDPNSKDPNYFGKHLTSDNSTKTDRKHKEKFLLQDQAKLNHFLFCAKLGAIGFGNQRLLSKCIMHCTHHSTNQFCSLCHIFPMIRTA